MILAEQTVPETPTIKKQIDRAVTHHMTSSSVIGTSALHGVSTSDYRIYGIPTVRADLAAPKLRYFLSVNLLFLNYQHQLVAF